MAPSKRRSAASPKSSTSAEAVFGGVGKKLANHKVLNRGLLAFRLTGAGGGDYVVECSQGGRIEKEYSSIRQPTVELIGDAERIQAIVGGKKEARNTLLAVG